MTFLKDTISISDTFLQSFHFAPRWASESFEQAMERYEHYVAMLLNLPIEKTADMIGQSKKRKEKTFKASVQTFLVRGRRTDINFGDPLRRSSISAAVLAVPCAPLRASFATR